MENIIEELIKIEQVAENSLKQTEQEKRELYECIKAEQAKIEASFKAEADKKISKIRAEMAEETKKAVSALEASEESELLRLKASFKENKVKWEKEVFDRVLSLN